MGVFYHGNRLLPGVSEASMLFHLLGLQTYIWKAVI